MKKSSFGKGFEKGSQKAPTIHYFWTHFWVLGPLPWQQKCLAGITLVVICLQNIAKLPKKGLLKQRVGLHH